jgi:hypothetical protein
MLTFDLGMLELSSRDALLEEGLEVRKASIHSLGQTEPATTPTLISISIIERDAGQQELTTKSNRECWFRRRRGQTWHPNSIG